MPTYLVYRLKLLGVRGLGGPLGLLDAPVLDGLRHHVLVLLILLLHDRVGWLLSISLGVLAIRVDAGVRSRSGIWSAVRETQLGRRVLNRQLIRVLGVPLIILIRGEPCLALHRNLLLVMLAH